MKILFATDCYLPSIGGIELTTSRLAAKLSKKGHTVLIIAPSINNKNYVEKENGAVIYRVASILTPFHKTLRYAIPFFANQTARKVLKKEKPDIIHIQTSASVAQSVFKAAKRNNTPINVTSNFMIENISENIPTGRYKIPLFITKIIETYLWRETNRLIDGADTLSTPTALSRKYLIDKTSTNKDIEVLSNGVDLSIFNNHRNGKHLLKLHKIESHIPIILYVGRMDGEKKVEVIIKSLPEILKHKKVKLLLVGRGGELSNLKKLATHLGVNKNIVFTGFASEEEIPNYYSLSDIFIMPSTAELQSIATLQAAASGLPVIAADAAALPELVKNGKNGFLFTPGDSPDLANKILTIIQNKKLAEKMGKESIKIAKRHDINQVVSKLERLYKTAVGGKNAL